MVKTDFLPISQSDLKKRGWDGVDFCFITGDAYVDHPSFGTAIISRVLESAGYRIGIIAQPDYHTLRDVTRLGRPRLGFLINAGNIDSMVAHYTAAKRKRSEDAYSPGGKAGNRPDRAVCVYTALVRQAYGNIPIIIGGLEASLRRFAHYDYWADAVFPSILTQSGADLLSFGMGEKSMLQIAEGLNRGLAVENLTNILGTCYKTRNIEGIRGIMLPSAEKVAASKTAYANACRVEYDEHDAVRGNVLIQLQQNGEYLVQNKPMPPLSTEELDAVYALPYARTYHPCYEKQGGVPAIKEVQFSITHNRGCFGACNFCSIAFHQGRQISVRSEQSVLSEARLLTKMPGFKGYIHDVGGPTANFRHTSCEKQLKLGLCRGKKCLAPTPCKNLTVDHRAYLNLLQKVRQIPGIKRVFIRSGIRFDYLIEDTDNAFFKELVQYHVSGQLKVAPEHCSAPVLDFYPTPGTLSTCMFYTGLDPYTLKPVYVAKTPAEKQQQRTLLQYYKPENRPAVAKALLAAGRADLIGHGPHCLIPPPAGYRPSGSAPGKPNGRQGPARGKNRPAVRNKNNHWQGKKGR